MARAWLSIVAVLCGCGDAALEPGATVPNHPVPPEAATPLAAPTTPEPAAREPAPAAAETPECVRPTSGCDDVPATGTRTLPIVLVHGMGGFDEFGPLVYFNGVAKALRDAGFTSVATVTDPLNGSDVRATQLAPQIDHVLACTCAEKVNLIGHSQGGLDARYLVNVLGYGDRVASVTTVSTPHAGTRVADRLLGLVPGGAEDLMDLVATLFLEVYTDPLQDANVRAALTWVSTDFLAAFAGEHPDDAAVAWFSYAGRAGLTAKGVPECEGADLPNPKQHSPVGAGLLPGWLALGGLQGVDNDGLVSVDSARLGHFRGCVPADHLAEIGVLGNAGWDHVGFYRMAAETLEDEGF